MPICRFLLSLGLFYICNYEHINIVEIYCTISNLFSQISSHYGDKTISNCYWKLRLSLVITKTKPQIMGPALIFLLHFRKQMRHISQPTYNWEWDIFLNVESKNSSNSGYTINFWLSIRILEQIFQQQTYMVTGFWDCKEILLMDFMAAGTTIISEQERHN